MTSPPSSGGHIFILITKIAAQRRKFLSRDWDSNEERESRLEGLSAKADVIMKIAILQIVIAFPRSIKYVVYISSHICRAAICLCVCVEGS